MKRYLIYLCTATAIQAQILYPSCPTVPLTPYDFYMRTVAPYTPLQVTVVVTQPAVYPYVWTPQPVIPQPIIVNPYRYEIHRDHP